MILVVQHNVLHTVALRLTQVQVSSGFNGVLGDDACECQELACCCVKF